MNHASKRYNHKSPNNIYGISPVRSDGNPAVKIKGGGRGSAELSLHCKNVDVVPKVDVRQGKLLSNLSV